MNRVIAIAKYTNQVTPEVWERKTISRTFDPSEPIVNVINWVKSKDADSDTLIIMSDESDINSIEGKETKGNG